MTTEREFCNFYITVSIALQSSPRTKLRIFSPLFTACHATLTKRCCHNCLHTDAQTHCYTGDAYNRSYKKNRNKISVHFSSHGTTSNPLFLHRYECVSSVLYTCRLSFEHFMRATAIKTNRITTRIMSRNTIISTSRIILPLPFRSKSGQRREKSIETTENESDAGDRNSRQTKNTSNIISLRDKIAMVIS